MPWKGDFKNGIVEGKNLSNKQKAIFLDRGGTINKYVGFLRNEKEFELLDGVATAIKEINNSGYLCIVVTNQPVMLEMYSSFDKEKKNKLLQYVERLKSEK